MRASSIQSRAFLQPRARCALAVDLALALSGASLNAPTNTDPPVTAAGKTTAAWSIAALAEAPVCTVARPLTSSLGVADTAEAVPVAAPGAAGGFRLHAENIRAIDC